MSAETNKAIVRRFMADVWQAGKLDVADELVHPAYVVPGVGQGPEAVKRNLATWRAAFPDLEWEIEDMLAEGDRVAVRFMLHGTHLGEFHGIAPTGRRVTMQEMAVWRIVDGKLHTGWFQADALGLRVQLGAISATLGGTLSGPW
jgi:predicted ester cyclase